MVATALLSFGGNTTETVFSCVFSAFIIAANLYLIFTILSRYTLRQNSKYILVLALAFIDLYVGVFEIPVYANMLLTGSSPSCGVNIVMQASPYFYIMMGCLAITAINLDFNFRISMTNYVDRTRRVMTGVLLALVIVVPIIILVPIIINGRSYFAAFGCIFAMTKTFARAANVVSYWVPVVCILVTSTMAVIKYRSSKRPLYGHQQFPTNYQHTSNEVGVMQYQQTTDMQMPASCMYQLPPNSQQLVGTGQNQQSTANQNTDSRMYQGNQLPLNSQQLVGTGQNQQSTANQNTDSRMYQGNQLPPNGQQFVAAPQYPDSRMYQGNQLPANGQQFVAAPQYPDSRMYQGNQLPANGQQFVAAPQYPGSPHQQAPILVQDPNNPSDLIVAALVTIVLLLPGQIIYMIVTNCEDPNCFNDYVFSLKLLQFLAYSKSFLVPLVWQLNKGFRDARRGVQGDQGVLASQNKSPTQLPPPYYSQQQDTDAPPHGVEHQQTKS